MAALLQDADPAVRAGALIAGHGDALAVVEALADSEPTVRAAAAEAVHVSSTGSRQYRVDI